MSDEDFISEESYEFEFEDDEDDEQELSEVDDKESGGLVSILRIKIN